MSTDQSTNIGLPFLMPAQAQKHVTVNESLLRLDGLVQLAVESRSISVQPGAPADGALWITPAGKTGADWGVYADWGLAYHRDGSWEPLTPKAGWRAWVKDEQAFTVYDGAAWSPLWNHVDALNGGALAGFRNGVINGCFRVWQRGTSFANAGGFTADRWFTNRGGGAAGLTVSRQAGPDSFRYAMRMQRDSGDAGAAGIAAYYTLETSDSIRYQGQKLTLSFWARRGANFSPTGESVSVSIRSGTGVDERVYAFTGSASIASASVNLTTSWQRFTVTTEDVVASTVTELGLQLSAVPTGTASANDWLEIAGVQLEPGETATPFERRAEAIEIALCERYFEKSYLLAVAPGSVSYLGGPDGRCIGTGHRHGLTFRTRKRAAPTMTFYNPQTGASGAWRDQVAGVDRTVTAVNIGETGCGVGMASTVDQNVYAGQWTADAEI